MIKFHLYTKQGENKYVFQSKNLDASRCSKIVLEKVKIFWRFENLDRDTTALTDQAGNLTNVSFGEGYWSFFDLKKRFAEEGVILNDYEINLGEVGPLLGFGRNKIISRGTLVDLGHVNVNKGLEYVSVSCNIVNNQKVLDRYGQNSTIIALLPVDTSQRLNGTSPINAGSYSEVEFTVKDNLPTNLVKLYLLCEVTIC